jgi:hypothetical protein
MDVNARVRAIARVSQFIIGAVYADWPVNKSVV